ncbi:MAG TPA: hypothetical protein VGM88_22985 [Kofleriaceae bacterium]|jgi:plasmid stability protein
MSQLIVRKIDPEVVAALRRRAAENGRSAEAEHREILRAALLKPRKSLVEHLLAMPSGLKTSDLRRSKSKMRRIKL